MVFSSSASAHFHRPRHLRRVLHVHHRGTGLVTVTLSDDARVYLRGRPIGSVTTNQPWTIRLPAGEFHTLRFRNASRGIDFRRRFHVQKNTEIRVQFSITRLSVVS